MHFIKAQCVVPPIIEKDKSGRVAFIHDLRCSTTNINFNTVLYQDLYHYIFSIFIYLVGLFIFCIDMAAICKTSMTQKIMLQYPDIPSLDFTNP